MADHLNGIDLLQGRCTAFAWDFLRELKANPEFPTIVDRLTKFDGLITRSDIERMLHELRKPDGK